MVISIMWIFNGLLLIYLRLTLINADNLILPIHIQTLKKVDIVKDNQNATDSREDEKPMTSLKLSRTEYDKPMSHLEHELLTCNLRMQILKWKQEKLPSFDTTPPAEGMSRDQVPTTESKCVTSSELAREFAQMRDELETIRTSKQKTEQELERLRLEHDFQVNKLQHEKLTIEQELELFRKPEENLLAEVEKMKQNLYEVLSNQSIQLHQENIHLILNNTQFGTDNLILKNRLQMITEENNLLNDKILEVIRENAVLKEKIIKFENNSKSLHLPYEDFVTAIEKKLHKDSNREIDELKTQVTSLSEKIGKIEHDLVNISDAIGLQDIFIDRKVNEDKCKLKVSALSLILIEDNYHFLSHFKANWNEAQEYCQSRGLLFDDNMPLFLGFANQIMTTFQSKYPQEVIQVWAGQHNPGVLHTEYDCKQISLPWLGLRNARTDCSKRLHFWCHMPISACNS